jgi:hypothetical protein
MAYTEAKRRRGANRVEYASNKRFRCAANAATAATD